MAHLRRDREHPKRCGAILGGGMLLGEPAQTHRVGEVGGLRTPRVIIVSGSSAANVMEFFYDIPTSSNSGARRD